VRNQRTPPSPQRLGLAPKSRLDDAQQQESPAQYFKIAQNADSARAEGASPLRLITPRTSVSPLVNSPADNVCLAWRSVGSRASRRSLFCLFCGAVADRSGPATRQHAVPQHPRARTHAVHLARTSGTHIWATPYSSRRAGRWAAGLRDWIMAAAGTVLFGSLGRARIGDWSHTPRPVRRPRREMRSAC
jgi:hypothetical protein